MSAEIIEALSFPPQSICARDFLVIFTLEVHFEGLTSLYACQRRDHPWFKGGRRGRACGHMASSSFSGA